MRLLLLLCVCATLLVPAPASANLLPGQIDPVLQGLIGADPARLRPVIVEMEPPVAPFPVHPKLDRAQQAFNLLGAHGRAVGMLPIVNGAAGFANAAGVAALSLAPGVAFVHEDYTVKPRRAAEARPFVPPGRLAAAYPRVIDADRTWSRGLTGEGVGVAVLDSGVLPDADLTHPTNRLVAAVNFAGGRGPTADAGGHGTHVAGIAAGNGAKSGREYVGVAPEANVVDVRVLNRNGNGRVSSILAGIQWAVANRAAYNIRVLNLSLGATARRSYRTDPLSAGVEIAWKRGLVVVVAAGNDGPNRGTVQTPGIDPYVVTVGAIDDGGTPGTADDQLAWFSSWGTPPDSTPKPDLVAPGRRIVSLRAPGSFLDQLYADRVTPARNGSSYFRLTGTSASTPMVAGTAALLLQRQPALTPDQVKAQLLRTAQAYGRGGRPSLPDPTADGVGLLDAGAAATEGIGGQANRGLRPSSVTARALYSVLYGQPLVWRNPSLGGSCWSCLTWTTLGWNDGAWDNADWDAFRWDDGAWDDGAWDDGAWDDGAWDDGAWDTAGLD